MLHCPKCGKQYSAEFEVCPDDQTPLQADSTVAGIVPGDPLIGHTLDEKYRLEERLGVGGMGTVYRAVHLLIDRPVAIKVLNQRFVEDEAARTRFRREARAAGRLQHTNAVTVTDFGQSSDGYVYIVMELLEGRTLREIVAKEAPLDPARAVSLMLQISDAVAAAHEAGIIHRDLKPANVFIVQRADVPSVVKVLDFGIAKLAAEILEDDEPMTLTQIGAMIGTPRYMSPEQCDGAELTPAADVYSLGIILYEMLTGTVPFSGSTPLAIALKQSTEIPRPPRDFVSTIPEPLEQLVLHALEKRPEDRPANAAQFRAELLSTAERLGFEHFAATHTHDLETLRNVGTESPSGRLVIDISRLRESRATIPDINELTVVREPAATLPTASAAARELQSKDALKFPRMSVPLGGSRKSKRQLVFVSVIIAAVLLLGIALATRSRFDSQASAPIAVASPSPTPTPSPSPSPTPLPSPSPTARAVAKPTPKKKGGFVNKVKRIFKNPF
ncbi:MAG TPA: protein kinase [Pyrinomonadaceae bacterium]|nr:protein kinase [Pyrinomonadaceae bacterium]